MRNSRLARSFGVAVTLVLIPPIASAQVRPDTAASEVHAEALVLDGHADVLLPSTPVRYALPGGGSRADLPHLIAGGVDAVVFSVAVGPGGRDPAAVAAARVEADAKLARIKAFATTNAARVALAYSPADVERLHGQSKIAVIIGFQNARSIGKDLSQLDAFFGQGAYLAKSMTTS